MQKVTPITQIGMSSNTTTGVSEVYKSCSHSHSWSQKKALKETKAKIVKTNMQVAKLKVTVGNGYVILLVCVARSWSQNTSSFPST